MNKTPNPYQRLKKRGYELFAEIVFCRRRTMFEWAVDRSSTYYIYDVKERVAAAQQLGFEVVVIADGPKLRFEYRTKRPESVPSDFSF